MNETKKIKKSVAENTGREMTNTPRDRLISRMSPSVDNNALLQKVGKVVNSPEFNSDAILKIVDAGDTMTHPVGRYIQKEFDELQYDLGRAYEDHPEEVAEKLLAMLIDRTQQGVAEGLHPMVIDDVKKLATLNQVDRYSAYANIRGYFKGDPELSKMASDLMGGYYEADMLRGKYKTAEAKAKYDELEPMNQAFIKQALGQEQGVAGGLQESRWSQKSSSKTSRAVAGRTEVIIRHTKPVDEEYAGSRSQRKNIKAIFIQNADGERLKYPFIHPAGAFAMAQHVDHGGVPHDPAGKAIIKMSEDIAQLQEFQRKIQRASLHNDATGITERAVGRLQELKSKINALGKRHHYESWVMEFNEQEHVDDGIMELDAVTMEEYKQKFTQTNFQEELAGYFPLLHKIMSETNAVDLEEYVAEQDIEEATALDRLKAAGGTRFAPGLPMPQHSAAPWDDDDAYYVMHNGPRAGESNPFHGPFADQQEAQAWIDSETPDPEEYSVDTLGNIGQIEHGKPVKQHSNFKNPNNPNRTGMDSARALAQRGMSPAESINAFEEWADATEQGNLTADQIRELQNAIKELPDGKLQLGTNGQTAIEFFADIVELHPELAEKFQKQYGINPDADPIKDVLIPWAEEEENYPNLITLLGLGNTEEPQADQPPQQPASPAPEQPTAPAPEQPTAENDDMSMDKGTMETANPRAMIKMIAEKVKSFYNRDNPEVGPFRGNEGIAIDVEKECSDQFGPQAGQQARLMAEALMKKLTNEWEERHGKSAAVGAVDPDDGLARLKELLGNVKSKVEGIGDQGVSTRDFNKNIMPAEGGPDKSQVPAFKRKEQGGDWKMSTKDLEKERDQSRTTKPGLDAHAAKMGVGEGEGDFGKAIENLHGWYEVEPDEPGTRQYDFDDREGGYYAQGTVIQDLKTGKIKVEFNDKAGEYGGNNINDTFNSIGDAMNALGTLTTQMRYNSGKKPNYDTLALKTPVGPDDVYKTNRAGKIGTLTKGRMGNMKASTQYTMRGGPKGPLPEMADILRLAGIGKK